MRPLETTVKRGTAIYIAAHKSFDPPQLAGYFPIQVGAAQKTDLGFIRDDEGDNISLKNPHYSELTALYWVWKNDATHDVLGLSHYRRFFLDDFNRILSAESADLILEEYDIIFPERIVLDNATVWDQYAELHHSLDLEMTRKAIEEICPEYKSAFEETVGGNYTYSCNMMIAGEAVFKEYAKWLFSVLFEVEKKLDISEYDTYNQRVFGFIAERLMLTYVLQNDLSVKEFRIGATEEKAETGEYIEKCAGYIVDEKFGEGYDFLLSVLKERPDTFLPNSDIHGTLKKMWYIFNIYHAEGISGRYSGVYGEKMDATALIAFFERLDHVVASSEHKDKAECFRLVSEHGITPTMIYVILNMRHERYDVIVNVMASIAEGFAGLNDPVKASAYAKAALDIGSKLNV